MVYQFDNGLYDDDDDYQCSTCFSFASSSSSSATQKQQTLNANFNNQQNDGKYNQSDGSRHERSGPHAANRSSLASKDLVGNNKEFRMENNKCNLRIIGNGNRIRISQNSGSLQIIGNSTRLKIAQNSGSIKYTGNEGRICLGSESTQQMVDYIGCNGLLKVINSTELNKSPKCRENNSHNNSNNTPTSIDDKVIKNNSKRKHLAGNAMSGTLPQHSSQAAAAATAATVAATSSAFQPRVKSASFEELIDMKQDSWKHFNDLLQNEGWQHFAKVSLPDLKENINEPSACGCKCKKVPSKKLFNNVNKKSNNNNENRSKSCSRVQLSGHSRGINISNHSNVVNNFGNIVIKNSVNVSIA